MKIIRIINQIFVFIILFLFSLFSSCNAQDNTDNSDNTDIDSIKMEVKIISVAPVGWGYIYKANVIQKNKSKTDVFNDTITFGITASVEYEELIEGEVYSIIFKNSKEICKTSYFPAITGTMSKENEIWLMGGKPVTKQKVVGWSSGQVPDGRESSWLLAQEVARLVL
ncbi:MAG: hypothetical protein RBR97_12430 [Bacteroidales bacterium]|nr:hypothetical protein [Bacteroidales bacterium]